MTLQSILKDIVSFAVPLNFEAIRVTSDPTKTLFEAIDEDKRIIMKAITKTPVAELTGQFALPNLKILKGYVDTFDKMGKDPAKKTKAKITVQNNSTDKPELPTDIEFNMPGVSKANYRLQLLNLPSQPTLKSQPTWDVEIAQPTKNKIAEFSAFASILSGVEKNFSVKTDADELKFFIGDENSSTSKVSFVFAESVNKQVNPQLYWRCQDFLNILGLAQASLTVVQISNLGIIQISVDTGLINYQFMLPGAKA